MLKQFKAAFMVFCALVLAMSGIAMAEQTDTSVPALNVEDLTVDYIFDGLGDALNYGVVTEKFYQDNHAETSVFVDELIRGSNLPFLNTETTYSYGKGYTLYASVTAPADETLKDMEFALFKVSGDHLELCEESIIKVEQDDNTAVLLWDMENESDLLKETLYVRQIKKAQNGTDYIIIEEGAKNSAELTVTYGPSVSTAAPSGSYIGKMVSSVIYGEGQAIKLHNTVAHNPSVEFGSGVRLVIKDNGELKDVTDCTYTSDTLLNQGNDVYIQYYDPYGDSDDNKHIAMFHTEEPACQVKYKYDATKGGYFFYENGGVEYSLAFTDAAQNDNGTQSAKALVDQARIISTQLGNIQGGMPIFDQATGTLDAGTPSALGNSTVTGSIDHNGNVVSVYNIELNGWTLDKTALIDALYPLENFKQSEDDQNAGNRRTSYLGDGGIYVAENEYVVINVICPSKGTYADRTDNNDTSARVNNTVEIASGFAPYIIAPNTRDSATWGGTDEGTSDRVIYNFIYWDESEQMYLPFEGFVDAASAHGGTLLAPSAHFDERGEPHNGAMIGRSVQNHPGTEIHQRTMTVADQTTWVRMRGLRNTADIELTKVNGFTGDSLSGATFGLYSDKECKTLVKMEGLINPAGTDVDGKIVFANLPTTTTKVEGEAEVTSPITYYIKEVSAPAGYILNTEVFEIEVEPGGFYTVGEKGFVTNDKGLGGLQLVKVDEDDLTVKLADATFGVYKDEYCMKPVEGSPFVTDANGEIEAILEVGTYWIKELEAPFGYELDDTPIQVIIEKDEITFAGQDGVVTNEKGPRGTVYLYKRDAQYNPLAGAEFTVYRDNACTVPYTTFKTEMMGQGIYQYAYGSANLPYGIYWIKETKAPTSNHVLSDTVYQVTINQSYPVAIDGYYGWVTNETGPATLWLEKVTVKDNVPEYLAGAWFGVYQGEELIAKGITDENGYVEFKVPANANYGQQTYTVKEIAAPNGYTLSSHVANYITVSAGERKKIEGDYWDWGQWQEYSGSFKNDKSYQLGRLTLFKGTWDLVPGEERGETKPLDGAVFGVYHDEACTMPIQGSPFTTVSEPGKDGRKGFIEVADLTPGRYYVKELKAPNGYLREDRVLAVDVTAGSGESRVQWPDSTGKNHSVVYNAKADAHARVDIEKHLINDTNNTMPEGAGFTFKMEYVNDDHSPADGYEFADGKGETTADFSYESSGTLKSHGAEASFAPISVSFTKTGVYTFKVYEVQDPAMNGYVIYDDEVYTITYTVSQNADGKLSIAHDQTIVKKSDGSVLTGPQKDHLAFTNKFGSVNISGTKVWDDENDALRLRIDKDTFRSDYLELSRLVKGYGFGGYEYEWEQEITAEQLAAWGATLKVYDGSNESYGVFEWYYENLPAFNDDGSEARYVIREMTVNGYQTFYVNGNDASSYRPDATDALYPRPADPNNTDVAVAIYNAVADSDLEITKEVIPASEDGVFDFTISPSTTRGYHIYFADEDGNIVRDANNQPKELKLGSDGKFHVTQVRANTTEKFVILFDSFTDAAKNFIFTVAEVQPDPNHAPEGWTFSDKNVQVQYAVTRNADHTVTVNKTFDDGDVNTTDDNTVFVNTYTEPVVTTTSLTFTKEWEGIVPQVGDLSTLFEAWYRVKGSTGAWTKYSTENSEKKPGFSYAEGTDGTWRVTVSNLPMVINGAEVEWSIVENSMDGYKTVYLDKDQNAKGEDAQYALDGETIVNIEKKATAQAYIAKEIFAYGEFDGTREVGGTFKIQIMASNQKWADTNAPVNLAWDEDAYTVTDKDGKPLTKLYDENGKLIGWEFEMKDKSFTPKADDEEESFLEQVKFTFKEEGYYGFVVTEDDSNEPAEYWDYNSNPSFTLRYSVELSGETGKYEFVVTEWEVPKTSTREGACRVYNDYGEERMTIYKAWSGASWTEVDLLKSLHLECEVWDDATNAYKPIVYANGTSLYDLNADTSNLIAVNVDKTDTAKWEITITGLPGYIGGEKASAYRVVENVPDSKNYVVSYEYKDGTVKTADDDLCALHGETIRNIEKKAEASLTLSKLLNVYGITVTDEWSKTYDFIITPVDVKPGSFAIAGATEFEEDGKTAYRVPIKVTADHFTTSSEEYSQAEVELDVKFTFTEEAVYKFTVQEAVPTSIPAGEKYDTTVLPVEFNVGIRDNTFTAAVNTSVCGFINNIGETYFAFFKQWVGNALDADELYKHLTLQWYYEDGNNTPKPYMIEKVDEAGNKTQAPATLLDLKADVELEKNSDTYWSIRVSGLPMFVDNKEIAYSVVETVPEGYKATYLYSNDVEKGENEAWAKGGETIVNIEKKVDTEQTITKYLRITGVEAENVQSKTYTFIIKPNEGTPTTFTIPGAEVFKDATDGKNAYKVSITVEADDNLPREKSKNVKFTFTDEGDYSFTVREDVPDNIPAGEVYDKSKHEVYFKVWMGASGLNVSKVEAPIEFINDIGETYLTVFKQWNGEVIDADPELSAEDELLKSLKLQWAYNVYDENGVALSVAAGDWQPYMIEKNGTATQATLLDMKGNVTVDEDWVIRLKRLPLYMNGKSVAYSVVETVPEVYKATYLYSNNEKKRENEAWAEHGETIVNTYLFTDVSVTKVWDGGASANLTENLKLYFRTVDADGKVTDTLQPAKLVKDGDKYTWSGLKKYVDNDPAKGEIKYIVKENPLPAGYAVSYEQLAITEDGENITYVDKDYALNGEEITNTKEVLSVPVYIQKELWQNYIQDASWTMTRTYKFNIEPADSNPDGCTAPETVAIKVVGTDTVLTNTEAATFSFTDAGTYIFTLSEDQTGILDCDKFASNEYTLTFKVQKDTNGKLSLAETLTQGTQDKPYIFQNRMEVATLITTKVWEDDSNKHLLRPATIPLTVYYRTCDDIDGTTGEAINPGEWKVYHTAEQTAQKTEYTGTDGNIWTVTITGLPAYIGNKPVQYGLVEGEINGYTTSYTDKNGNPIVVNAANPMIVDGQGKGSIINTVKTTEVQVTKIWENRTPDNKDISENLKLYQVVDGKETEITATVVYDSDADTYTWSKLPAQTSDGKEITYRVREVNVPAGYTVDYHHGETQDYAENGGRFTNTYSATKSVTFAGTKTLVGRTLEAGEFSFELVDEAGNVIETVSNDADGKIAFSAISYTDEDNGKTFNYTVREVEGTLSDVYYDTEACYVQVKVTDNGDGTLSVAHTTASEAIAFTNIYAEEGSINIAGTKTLTGRGVKAGEFSFELYDQDNKLLQTVSNDKNGTFAFDSIEYERDDAGKTFTYFVKEEDGNLPGVSYDDTVYTVKVAVHDDGSGKIKAEFTADTKTIVFYNHYTASNSVTFEGTKKLEGRAMTVQDVFTFTITEGAKVWTATNDINGKIAYPTISYTLADVGTHTYTVKETSTDGNGITVDGTSYTVTVKVSDDGDGKLKVEPSANATALDFTNKYTAAASVVLSGTKTLDGRDLAAGEFSFVLMDEDGTVIDTVTNDAEGNITFKALTYTEADVGSHIYQVKEVKGSLKGVEYSDAVITVTVKVTDDGKGNLTAAVTKNSPAIAFTNIYTADGEVHFSGKKTLTGRTLAEGDFTFILSNEAGEVLQTKTNKVDGTIVFDPIKYDQDDAGKQFKYTVQEIKAGKQGYTYDSTVYSVTVDVKIDAEDHLVVTASDNAHKLNFTNAYKAEGELELGGIKTLEGKKLTAEAFTFVLTDGDGNVIETVKNGADGSIKFSAIKYDQEAIGKTYTYKVKEVDDGQKGITYDSTVYTVKVKIVDNGNGKLTAQFVGEKPGIKFINTYKEEVTVTPAPTTPAPTTPAPTTPAPTTPAPTTPAPTATPTATPKPAPLAIEFAVSGSKALNGREFRAGEEFWFLLLEDDTVIQRCKVQPVGDSVVSFTFEAITYTEAGTYNYTVCELNGNARGMSYDTTLYTVTVNVTETSDNKLVADVAYAVEGKAERSMMFTNTYSAQTELELTAQKLVDGAEPAEDQVFDFILEGNGVEMKAQNVKDSIVFDKLTFTEKDAGKTYTYTIKETTESTELLIADASVYEVKVTVSDNGDGTLKLDTVITKDGEEAKSILFNNQQLAHLTISKKVEGVETDEAFDMIVRLYDAEGDELTAAYAYTGDVTGLITSGGTIALADGQSVTIKGLPEGTKYTVEESASKAFTTTVNGENGVKAEGIATGSDSRADFVNTLETTTFSVTKVWEGGDLGAISLTIYADGKQMVPQPEIDRADNVYTVTGLPKYNEDGNAIVYSAKEKGVEGYIRIYQNVDPYEDVTDVLHDGGTVTNRREKQVSFKIKKVWEGLKEGEDTPAITLTLYCNGEKMDVPTPKPDSNGWYRYYDLPVAIGGQTAVYTVVEEPVDGFTTTYVDANGAEAEHGVHGGKIINTKVPETGDTAQLGLWLTMMTASAAMLVMLLRRRKAY